MIVLAGAEQAAPTPRDFTPTTRLEQSMAQGHWMRTGHTLAGYYEPVPERGEPFVRLVKTCCDR